MRADQKWAALRGRGVAGSRGERSTFHHRYPFVRGAGVAGCCAAWRGAPDRRAGGAGRGQGHRRVQLGHVLSESRVLPRRDWPAPREQRVSQGHERYVLRRYHQRLVSAGVNGTAGMTWSWTTARPSSTGRWWRSTTPPTARPGRTGSPRWAACSTPTRTRAARTSSPQPKSPGSSSRTPGPGRHAGIGLVRHEQRRRSRTPEARAFAERVRLVMSLTSPISGRSGRQRAEDQVVLP